MLIDLYQWPWVPRTLPVAVLMLDNQCMMLVQHHIAYYALTFWQKIEKKKFLSNNITYGRNISSEFARDLRN